MEYQVYFLDENEKYPTRIGPILFQTDSMDKACLAMSRINENTGSDICVFQERTSGFRQYIQKPKRDRCRPFYLTMRGTEHV